MDGFNPDPYTRCPRCDQVAAPLFFAYTPTTDGKISWRWPVQVRCGHCGHVHDIGKQDVLVLDACTRCADCHEGVEIPGAVTLLRCRSCGSLTAPTLRRRPQPRPVRRYQPKSKPADPSTGK